MPITSKPKTAKSGALSSTITLPKAGGVTVYCAHTHIVPLEELLKLKNPRNPNKHPKRQIELLAKILANGWRYPVVVSLRSGLVVKGHGRIDASAFGGLTHCPVDYQQYATEEEELADLLADNAIAELSELDMPSVAGIISDIDTGRIDLQLTGYDPKAIERMMLAAPPDPAEPKLHECPKCHYKWGKVKPTAKAAKKKTAAKKGAKTK